jgi:predicted acylesterase/phospholipase RssA
MYMEKEPNIDDKKPTKLKNKSVLMSEANLAEPNAEGVRTLFEGASATFCETKFIDDKKPTKLKNKSVLMSEANLAEPNAEGVRTSFEGASATFCETKLMYKRKLVLSGGGVKGIAHIGALYALDKLNYLDKFEEFAGTSIGSLMIAMYVIGYSPAEMYDFIKLFNMAKLKDFSITNIGSFGLDSGSRVEYVLKKIISKKGFNENITLKELYDITKKKLIFTAVCLNTMKPCYISYDTYPDMPLYLSIRMSSSLPFIYCPVKYENKLYIDGGCIDNYPINIFKNELGEVLDDVLGILLVDPENTMNDIDNLETYILRVLNCITIGMQLYSKKGFEKRTIDIHVEMFNIINFDINDKIKDELFLQGFKAIMNNKSTCERSE